MFKKKFDEGNVFKGIFLAYFILLFHVGLLALMGVLLLFFGGIVNYIVWILVGGAALLGGTVYFGLRRLKKQKGSLSRILMMPEFRGKNIEVNVLGGLASLKVTDDGQSSGVIEHDSHLNSPQQIESPESARIRELTELARLLENDLISFDEYSQAKKNLFGSQGE